MKCECGTDTKTKDSRRIDAGVWRKRFCPNCGAEFTTLEQKCETERYPYPPKKDKARAQGVVKAPAVRKVVGPKQRKPAPEPALKAKPMPAERQVVRAAPKAVDPLEKPARDRIEDLKFEREQRDHGWD
jgi:hypothetical protein